MAKLPDPPSVAFLRSLDPPVVRLLTGTALARIYFAGGDHPVAWSDFRHWGPVRHARFDHHLLDAPGRAQLQARGVLYCAPLAMTCVAEVFQQSRVIDRVRREPYLTMFDLARNVRLLDITGEFATRMGASLAIHSGSRNRARLWAAALYDAFDCDGLLYNSSMHPRAQAIVLSERAIDALPPAPDFNRPLADPSLTDVIDACAHRLGYLKG